MRTTLTSKKQMGGFTLIEMMIVVAIIAIISAVAYPSYQESVRKTNRADAMDTILSTAHRLERCYTSFGSYNNAGCTVPATVTSTKGYYEIEVDTDASTYTLTAEPVAGTPQEKDTKCTSFVLTNTGKKTATGSASDKCW